jgi:hypothetical protein
LIFIQYRPHLSRAVTSTEPREKGESFLSRQNRQKKRRTERQKQREACVVVKRVPETVDPALFTLDTRPVFLADEEDDWKEQRRKRA